jgi:hypothetical protein
LHALVEINPVVELAAALADEGEAHGVEEAEAAADVGGRFALREIPIRRGDFLGGRRRSGRLLEPSRSWW